ncbi:hypothetical protein SPH9361_02700 [Sphingobium sp. CECT 9361]|nr:hypothetical protein SPH9361_02700 [Sphingobium sp. CECT 9361]
MVEGSVLSYPPQSCARRSTSAYTGSTRPQRQNRNIALISKRNFRRIPWGFSSLQSPGNHHFHRNCVVAGPRQPFILALPETLHKSPIEGSSARQSPSQAPLRQWSGTPYGSTRVGLREWPSMSSNWRRSERFIGRGRTKPLYPGHRVEYPFSGEIGHDTRFRPFDELCRYASCQPPDRPFH